MTNCFCPGAQVDISNFLAVGILRIVNMTANDTTEIVLSGMIDGTQHDLAAKKTVKVFELLGVVGNVYGMCSQIDSEVVKKLE